MTERKRHDGSDDLIEPQGVNAGPPVDEEAPDREERAGGGRPGVPDRLDLLEGAPDRMAGAPGQRPGYPGQQRSVDTG